MYPDKSDDYKLYLELKEKLKDEIDFWKVIKTKETMKNYQLKNKEKLKEYNKNYKHKYTNCDVCNIKVLEYYMPKHCLTKKHMKKINTCQ